MNKLYYDPSQAFSFSSLRKYQNAAVKRGYPSKSIRDWLLRQDAYTLHKPARQNFLRNPYTVNNVGDLWELDLADMSSLALHNGGHNYLLKAIDAFSKYACWLPLRSKTVGAVASAFRSILAKNGNRRPLVVRTDKGKVFVNAKFRELLDSKGIEMRVCRNPDVECAIVERFSRTLKSKLYK
jgi:transposase InsO family protein